MKKKISIILGIGIIVIAVIMPFHLKNICYEHSMHPEWSFGAWNAVFVSALLFSIVIIIFTSILLLLNFIKNKNVKS